MAKAKQAQKGPKPTFEVRLVGEGISPEAITLRQVGDALSAIQDIASGRDPFEQSSVPAEKGIGLVDVSRGSAVFSCVARSPNEALENLALIGQMLRDIETIDFAEQAGRLVAALQPIQNLCDVARIVGCEIEVRANSQTIFSLQPPVYQQLSRRLLVTGETTIVGRVQRVGGATGMKCALRIDGRRKLLYCNVKDRKLVRRLGQKLYEPIAATGIATWISRTWRLRSFTISDFSQPRLGDVDEMFASLRAAGLDAWDHVDIDETLREMRN